MGGMVGLHCVHVCFVAAYGAGGCSTHFVRARRILVGVKWHRLKENYRLTLETLPFGAGIVKEGAMNYVTYGSKLRCMDQ